MSHITFGIYNNRLIELTELIIRARIVIPGTAPRVTPKPYFSYMSDFIYACRYLRQKFQGSEIERQITDMHMCWGPYGISFTLIAVTLGRPCVPLTGISIKFKFRVCSVESFRRLSENQIIAILRSKSFALNSETVFHFSCLCF